MNIKQQAILVGMILGDAFLQKTGEKNARIRLEQSEKQRDYLVWKARQFPQYFQGKPTTLIRTNPVFKKTYSYVRWQSNASPEIGKYRHEFYRESKKIIPATLSKLLRDPIGLAVWYMDDGYYYHRDKMAYIYLPRLTSEECKILLTTLNKNFGLHPTIKLKKRGEHVLSFRVAETKILFSLIAQFIIPSMQYKLLDPVSTDLERER